MRGGKRSKVRDRDITFTIQRHIALSSLRTTVNSTTGDTSEVKNINIPARSATGGGSKVKDRDITFTIQHHFTAFISLNNSEKHHRGTKVKLEA